MCVDSLCLDGCVHVCGWVGGWVFICIYVWMDGCVTLAGVDMHVHNCVWLQACMCVGLSTCDVW